MCGDFIDEFYQDEIDIPALLRDLKLNKGSLFYNFDASKYLVNSYSWHLFPTPVSIITPVRWKDSSRPYRYKDRNGTEKECDFEGIKLNKRICQIEDNIAISISFDGSKFQYNLKIAYKDATSFKQDALNTDYKGDFKLSDKYNAVNIPTNDIEDVYELYKQYYGSTYNFRWVEDYISYRILDIYYKTNSISEIKSIYEEAPIFVLQKLGDLLLQNDLEELLKYDKGNWIVDGWFKDSSDAIIKLLSSFNNLETLYNYLYNDVKNLMDIYNHLDKHNCIALGQIIDMLIMYKQLKNPNFQPDISEQEYTLGSYYSIDSNVSDSIFNNTPENIYLKNIVTEQENVGINAKTGSPIIRNKDRTLTEGYFHPFTLIPIKQIKGNEQQIEYQSALLVKAQADADEWTDVAITAQIVANILAIIISVATFGTATPFAMALLTLEIGLTTADILVVSIQKELEQTEGGREFLDKWNKFMLVGAVVTAGPALFKGALQLGSRILKSTVSRATKQFVTKCIATAILERNIANFAKSGTKTTIKEAIILNDSINSATSGLRLSPNFLDELYKNEAYILKSVTNEGKESYHFIYKGEILEEAETIMEVEKSLKELAKKKGTQLTKSLDELERLIPKLSYDNKYWTCFNNAGTELRWANVSDFDIKKSIETALKNEKNKGKLWEGEVAQELSKYDKVTDFGNEYEIIKNGKKGDVAGDIDVGSSKYIIECKESISKNIKKNKFLEQFDKYFNPKNPKYINVKNKKVVLAIKELGEGLELSHPVFTELQNQGVIIITDLKQIKNLK